MVSIVPWICVLVWITLNKAFQCPAGSRPVSKRSPDSCMIENKVYENGQRIMKDHPCHVCYCRRGEIKCYWQECGEPLPGCRAIITDEKGCNPSAYMCDIRKKYEVRFAPEETNVAAAFEEMVEYYRNSSTGACYISGVSYWKGQQVDSFCTACLECFCFHQKLKCIPKCCFMDAEFYDTPEKMREKAANRSPYDIQPFHPY
ncbi:uncharacterized protein LOC129231870 [Uloborus diversus]|uniref:uncharacterized protein LOC129231870 n=1 Tax=Uloborus diversus TaxID=327109 RepID=UPI002409F214|nr:uncharacterized protein LOC129231870 [Uloborus diversus]